MTPAERTDLIALLEQTRADFVGALTALSREKWKWKRVSDAWSICELAEHIVLAERRLITRVRTCTESPAAPEVLERTQGKTDLLWRVLPESVQRAEAPDPLLPKGNWTVEEALENFNQIRDEVIRFVSDTSLDLHSYAAEHPFPAFGALSAYQWLLYIPLHAHRHVRQIHEVRHAGSSLQASSTAV